MVLIKVDHHWIPTGFHGSITYSGSDISQAIEQAVNQATKRMPASLKPSLNEAKYLLEPKADGTSLLTFEITS